MPEGVLPVGGLLEAPVDLVDLSMIFIPVVCENEVEEEVEFKMCGLFCGCEGSHI